MTLRFFENANDIEKVRSRASKSLKTIKSVFSSTKNMLSNLRDANQEVSLDQDNCDLAQLINECLQEKFLIPTFHTDFIYKFHHKNKLWVDREKVKRIINNCLQNIFTAVRSNYSITLSFITEVTSDNFCEITIKNTGSSCNDIVLQRLFKGNYSTKSDVLNQGTGTGIIKKFVNLHGGDVWADSSVDQNWFSIHFTLPLSKLPALKHSLPSNSSMIGLSSLHKESEAQIKVYEDKIISYCSSHDAHLRIVLLDDENEHLSMVKSILFSSGRLVNLIELITFDSTHAFKSIDIDTIDLLITDIDFHGKPEGINLIREIRDGGRLVPICTHSDHSITQAKEIYEAGVDFVFE